MSSVLKKRVGESVVSLDVLCSIDNVTFYSTELDNSRKIDNNKVAKNKLEEQRDVIAKTSNMSLF